MMSMACSPSQTSTLPMKGPASPGSPVVPQAWTCRLSRLFPRRNLTAVDRFFRHLGLSRRNDIPRGLPPTELARQYSMPDLHHDQDFDQDEQLEPTEDASGVGQLDNDVHSHELVASGDDQDAAYSPQCQLVGQ